jgi:type IV secretion system protein VirB3
MDTPRQITIHPSVHRPRLILGADRELVLSTALVSAILVFALVTWWSIALGAILWLVVIAGLIRMGKEDPRLRHLYLRHVQYDAFYPAKSGLESSSARLPRRWE